MPPSSYERALAKKRDASALVGYANALNTAGRHAEAETAAREALQEDPQHALAASVLSLALLALNRDEEALSITESFGDVKGDPLALAHIAALVATGGTGKALDAIRQQVTQPMSRR